MSNRQATLSNARRSTKSNQQHGIAFPAFERLEDRTMMTAMAAVAVSGDAVTINGRAAALTGYSNYTLFNKDGLGATEKTFLNDAHTNGINMVRIWLGFQWADGISPFSRDASTGKFNLESLNPTYFAKLERFVNYADSDHIVVQLCLFDAVQLDNQSSDNRWKFSPYNPANNSNTDLAPDLSGNNRNVGYISTSGPVWNKVQLKLVQQATATLKNNENVIYEVMNEPNVHGFGGLQDGVVSFHKSVVTAINTGLQGASGSNVILVNANTTGKLQTWALNTNSGVSMVSIHTVGGDPASQAMALRDQGKPIEISTDGDGVVGPPNSASDTRLQSILRYTFGGGVDFGSRSIEVLDNTILGSSDTDGSPQRPNYTINPALISTHLLQEIHGAASWSSTAFNVDDSVPAGDADEMNQWTLYPQYYIAANGLEQAFGDDLAAATAHWLSSGINEGRSPNPFFSAQRYFQIYPGLQTFFGATNYIAGALHWLAAGIYEHRTGM